MAGPIGERESLERTIFSRVLNARPGMRVEFTRLDLVAARTAYVYPEHPHAHFEIMVPLHGSYECSINGEWVTAHLGQVVIIQPGDRHADRITAGQKYCAIGMCLFWEVHSPTVLLAPGLPVSMQVITVDLGDLIDLLIAEVRCRDSVAAFRQDALIYEVLMRLARAVPVEYLAPMWSGDSDRERFDVAVRQIFQERAPSGLTAAELADVMHMSTSALNASFRKHLHTTPAKALTDWRIEQARKLLLVGDISIGDIAGRLGFADISHFTHVFKRIVGVSPTRLRKNGQNKT